jgi:hypothetical protein
MGASAWMRRSGEVVWLKQYLGGAIAKRALQLKYHQPVTINA